MKWILFDVGGVLELVDDHNWSNLFLQRWTTRLALTPEQAAERLQAAQLPRTDIKMGTEVEYWRRIARAFELDDRTKHAMREDFWNAYCGRPNTELIEYARGLAGRAGTAILSNSGDGAREEEERRYGFAAIFDPICYSHEQGVTKPDPAAYRSALKRMGAEPPDVLFIDDQPVAIEGAEACGIRSVLHTHNDDTIGSIEAFLAR